MGKEPSLSIFFWFFSLHQAEKISWISLSIRPQCNISSKMGGGGGGLVVGGKEEGVREKEKEREKGEEREREGRVEKEWRKERKEWNKI
ncbi:hypothetical protein CR513_11160, partial [Mucuna pruriens]